MIRETATANEILMTDTVTLRPMTVADLGVVSHLGISSKASWGYASQLMKIFAKELTLEASALEQLSTAQVACQNGQILGYFTIREHADGIWELEHLFVHPEHFGRGIGQEMLGAALTSAKCAGAAKLTVIVDPHSAGFYERFGATPVGEHQSTIAGRVIPIYEFGLCSHPPNAAGGIRVNQRIAYAVEPELSAEEFADALRRSTLAERRPADDITRLSGMLRQADVIVTARDQSRLLVGVARSITDFHYCTYLSDLAVDREYQRQGIGRELIRLTHETAGLETTLILLAAPAAREYYPHIGMEQHDSCWITRPNTKA